MVSLMGTKRYRSMLQDIYAVDGVDGFNGIPKGSEAATWNQSSRLQKQQPALRDPGEDDFLSPSKNDLHEEPEGCEALIPNRS
jgi:hypothetical protein